jgi:hypothetical protein
MEKLENGVVNPNNQNVSVSANIEVWNGETLEARGFVFEMEESSFNEFLEESKESIENGSLIINELEKYPIK